MPLTELSPNVRRPGTHSPSSRSPKKGPSSTRTTTSLAPNAVQSMLRTATETGDIGQFSLRPSRLPRSRSRVPTTRRRSGSTESAFPPTLPRDRSRWPRTKARIANRPRQMPSSSTLSRQDTIHSSLTSYRRNPRARPPNVRHYPFGNEGLASPPAGPHGFYSHRSLMTLRSQGGICSTSSNSPVRHAGRRLPRPYHRGTSPAYSDALSHGYKLQPNYHRSASVGTATSSPVPMFSRPPGMPAYSPYVNSSVASSVRLPSPAIQPPYHGFPRSPFLSRTHTPISLSTRGLQRSPTGATIPEYYDYSESFLEGDCLPSDVHASATSLLFNMDRTILESNPNSIPRRAQTPFGTMPGSTFHPAELPTIHNRTASEQSKHNSNADVPTRKSSRNFSERSKTLKAVNHKVPHFASQSAIAPVAPKEDDARRSSATSRRTCSSSPSSSFFPNASRSARDLTSLAARVHSPVRSDKPQFILGLDSIRPGSDGGDESVESRGAEWQLPSLKFRPLSFVNYAQSNTERPKSAEGAKTNSTTEIISPTPERPVSSQSRRRFSKILGIKEGRHSITSTVPRSCNSLNIAKLKRVVESPENTGPPRFPIPPYSPRRSTIEEGTDEDNVDEDGHHDTNLSQTTGNAKSTVESLLDNHIQCLGLRREVFNDSPGAEDDLKNQAESLTASGTETTVKLSAHKKRHWHERPRPRTADSACQSTLASPERELLIPNKLFSKRIYPVAPPGSPRPTSTHSMPCISDAASPERTGSRPSTGWYTLASTSELLSTPPTHLGFEANFGKSLQEQTVNAGIHKVRRRPGVTLSPSVSSCRSQTFNEIDDCDEDAGPQKKRRNDYLVGKASERRKIRVRLKLKRDSTSQGRLANRETSSRSQATFLAACGQTNVEEVVPQEHLQDMRQSVELPAHGIRTHTPVTIDQVSEGGLATIHSQKSSGTPEIPHRWSSIVAIAPEVVRPSLEIHRLASIRTARSHQSNASLAEPINSTRPSAQIPRLSQQISHVAAADLAPSLSALNLDMSVRYPNMTARPRPVLRETRSFFSDDSSAIHQQRGSLRDRFHFHNFRSVLPSSPRATMVSDGADMTPRSNVFKPRQSRQTRGHSGEEEERDLYGTVGMTDFAYRKRKVIERLRDWWNKHCIHRKLGLKRKKSSKEMAKREDDHGLGGGMI